MKNVQAAQSAYNKNVVASIRNQHYFIITRDRIGSKMQQWILLACDNRAGQLKDWRPHDGKSHDCTGSKSNEGYLYTQSFCRSDSLPLLPNMNNFIHSVIKCDTTAILLSLVEMLVRLGHCILKQKQFTSNCLPWSCFGKMSYFGIQMHKKMYICHNYAQAGLFS